MKIEVNGEFRDFNDKITLENLVQATIPNTKGIAVAVNNSVVPKNSWSETLLYENDKVLLIKATQGG